ncbi:Starch-binding associating with outer membrane [Pedobacter steynii]|uniref:Starch-binding associating with outer membrane n=1 Tax=Pedobacter steynii TaxID=430522 RepID=A0A1G9SRW4_9SPHI|nr:RagB/SusD family nutrient uptake outer membrane protein [Pedobacter steynii]NQX37339.1 RagB/SusD family nutrient uptake outer membrane protein [Pedobacter steynii]SDM38162.1 Starch-binding associating with outer membrane [Pedobacter steynii]
MKLRTTYILALGLITIGMTACKKDFLQRDPQTEITEGSFFQSPADLETYSNGFYKYLSPSYSDISSDNIANYNADGEVDLLVRGGLSSANVGGWGKKDWEALRTINFMLDHIPQVKGDPALIKHFVGIARFYRANFYFEKIKKYHNVPWFNKTLTADDPALMKTQDPRALVADSVLSDLNYAAENIKPDGTNTRVTKWAALALLSRFALHEGTFRKYHDEIQLTGDYQRFLDAAIAASAKIMKDGGFSITNTGKGGLDYRDLFSSANLSANKEVIMLADYSKELGLGNNSHTVLDYTWSLSRNLADTYLKTDGTPFTSSPGYDTKVYTEVFADRDPRMMETIINPAFRGASTIDEPYRIKPTLGGYNQIKFYPRSADLRQGWELNYTDLPIFRYAEVLLINAEAKAESGTISQADLDQTVNVLRARVKMPFLNVGVGLDPVLSAAYPNANAANRALLLEIRRERRVELACEGRRFDDLMRWKSGKLFQDSQQGMYVPALGAMDVTGDGQPDIAILPSPNDESAIAGLPVAVREKLSKYYLKDKDGKDQNFYLSKGTSGFIAFTRDRDQPRIFIEPKYYYRPIPISETVVNPQLKQVFGW